MSFSKVFFSALAFRCGPGRLLDTVAKGLVRMRSVKDGKLIWNLDPNVRNTEALCFHAFSPLTVRWGTSNLQEGWAPEPAQATLTLICSAVHHQQDDIVGYGIKLEFRLNMLTAIEPQRGSGEAHVLATCASIAMCLMEERLLDRQQLPAFWNLTEGTWQTNHIFQPTAQDSGMLLSLLQPFGWGQITEEGVRLAVEIRSWVTGCVKWCGLTAMVEFGVELQKLAQALVTRAINRADSGDLTGAVADYTDVIELAQTPPHVVAYALARRGTVRNDGGDPEAAIADFTAAIESPNASTDLAVYALFSRGAAKSKRNDVNGAIRDYQAVMVFPNAPSSFVEAADQQLMQLVPSMVQESLQRQGFLP